MRKKRPEWPVRLYPYHFKKDHHMIPRVWVPRTYDLEALIDTLVADRSELSREALRSGGLCRQHAIGDAHPHRHRPVELQPAKPRRPGAKQGLRQLLDGQGAEEGVGKPALPGGGPAEDGAVRHELPRHGERQDRRGADPRQAGDHRGETAVDERRLARTGPLPARRGDARDAGLHPRRPVRPAGTLADHRHHARRPGAGALSPGGGFAMHHQPAPAQTGGVGHLPESGGRPRA